MNLFKVELINFAHIINCNLFSVVNFKTSAESRPKRSPENRMWDPEGFKKLWRKSLTSKSGMLGSLKSFHSLLGMTSTGMSWVTTRLALDIVGWGRKKLGKETGRRKRVLEPKKSPFRNTSKCVYKWLFWWNWIQILVITWKNNNMYNYLLNKTTV